MVLSWRYKTGTYFSWSWSQLKGGVDFGKTKYFKLNQASKLERQVARGYEGKMRDAQIKRNRMNRADDHYYDWLHLSDALKNSINYRTDNFICFRMEPEVNPDDELVVTMLGAGQEVEALNKFI